jgi:hypothetical protein
MGPVQSEDNSLQQDLPVRTSVYPTTGNPKHFDHSALRKSALADSVIL